MLMEQEHHKVSMGRHKLLKEMRVEQKGFEPSTPTLRTWCSPS